MNQQADQEGTGITAVDTNAVEPYTSVDADPHSEQGTPLFPVSEGKLLTLYLLSFGLYGVYWFYKNWKLQQPSMDKKIYPLLRAIFSIFFTHSLFKRINELASQLEKKHRFNANLLATIYVVSIVLSHLIDRLYMAADDASAGTGFIFHEALSGNTVIIISVGIFLLSAIPLVQVQATANRINDDMLGYLNHRYSIWNYILIATGTLFWAMLGLGILANLMGFAEV
jgi:hypothetical protein